MRSRMTKDDFLFGYGRRIFCVPPHRGQAGLISREVRATPAPPSLPVSSLLLPASALRLSALRHAIWRSLLLQPLAPMPPS